MLRRLCLLFAAVLLVTAIPGCTARIASPTAPHTAIPATSGSEPITVTYADEDWGYPSPFGFYPRGPGYVRMSLLFDTLVWKDQQGIVPLVAQDWSPSEDGLTWTLSLRHDVTFHDGQRLTAEDVVFSYRYLQAHQAEFTWNAGLDKLAGIVAPDDYAVVISLTEPMAGFLVDMAGVVPILPKHVWEQVEDPGRYVAGDAVLGSGPFTLAEYSQEEQRYIYEANPDYFLGKPVIDRLVFLNVPDGALALQTGDVDAAPFSGKDHIAVEQLVSSGKTAIEGPSFWVLQVIINTERQPLDSPAVRQALATAIDREQIVRQVTQEGAMVASLGIVSPSTDWACPDLPEYPCDPAAARATLSEMGLDDLALTLITTSTYIREAELIQADLAKAGVRVEIRTGDNSTVDGLLREGAFDLAVAGHGAIANPTTLATPDWPAGIYQSDDYGALYAAQSAEVDPDTRQDMVYQLQTMVAGQLPVITLYHPRMWLVYDAQAFDGWYFTEGGIATGIPLAMNKLMYLPE